MANLGLGPHRIGLTPTMVGPQVRGGMPTTDQTAIGHGGGTFGQPPTNNEWPWPPSLARSLSGGHPHPEDQLLIVKLALGALGGTIALSIVTGSCVLGAAPCKWVGHALGISAMIG